MKSTINSGSIGFIAGITNMSLIFPLRTISKYQYKYNFSINKCVSEIYKEGKISRFYYGYIPTIIDCGLCKSIDIYIYNKINNDYPNKSIVHKSILIGLNSSVLKATLTPLDCISNIYHVYGHKGTSIIQNKIKNNGIMSLYNGVGPILILTTLSNILWFGSFQFLEKYNKYNINTYLQNGMNGFISSSISNIILNPIRVLKIYKQTSTNNNNYLQHFSDLIKDNKFNIFYRGLSSRVLIYGVQSALFTIIWKRLESYNNNNNIL